MSTNQNIYLVGIKGVGMMALAVYLKERGKRVWGSDTAEVFPTDAVLSENNIKVLEGFKAENITDNIDLVVTTGAHGGLTNPEVEEAKKKGIPVMTLAQEVGHLMQAYKTKIAVCGSHGKTTTSAMMAYVLNKLGLQSSHLVGTARFSGLTGGHYGGLDFLTVEADEYVSSPGTDETPRFMHLQPDVIICTNVDHDHPDVYPTQEDLDRAYLSFFKTLDSEKGILVYCEDDRRLVQLVFQLDLKHKRPYSRSDIPLSIPGEHNQLNASAVLVLCDALGLNTDDVKKHLHLFSGSARRLEKIFEANDTILYDDYAHHPVEIAATISALRNVYPHERLVIIFQSHTYSRTKAFLPGFAATLQHADMAFVTDIFASAREKTHDVSAKDIVNEASSPSVEYCPFDKIVPTLKNYIHRGDIIVTMGAGSLYQAHSGIIELVKKL